MRYFNELVLFKHSVFSLPFIFIAMFVAADGWFGVKLFILGILATISARNFAMSFNRFVDMDFDRLNPRTKNRPSVDGRLSKNSIVIFMAINGIAFVGVSYFINLLAFKLSIPFLVILGFYSLVKRFSYFAHLFLGLALSLAPIAGAIAVLGFIPIWVYYLAFGVLFWVSGFDLIYALQDLEFDKKSGLNSIPAKFGVKNTLRISRFFHFLTIIFWFMFIQGAPNLGILSMIGLLFAFVMLSWEQYIVFKGLENINRAFFTVNGYLGFIFLFFILGDIFWN
jgi:4-hydroxybenzoate polyprenyltransferase